MALATLKPGTIIAFWGTDWLSQLISVSTLGPSHVGIIGGLKLDKCAGPIIYESTTLSYEPCLINDEFIDGVQAHCLASRVASYKGAVHAYHLHPSLELSPLETMKLDGYLKSMLGKTYDTKAAVFSATHLLKYRFKHPDLDTIFCSALVARALMLLNRMNWSNPEWFSPSGLVHELRKDAICHKIERLK